ncbi:STY4534 family ICE replication protein [Rodentibacter genomosp. 2]|uniref:DUF3577 domain-containing protein n=1 Tax=Rodentibacter genomosp. 2 TaxID=1908266 RepID=A0A1V3JKX8_9PAST|nr:STY4534 family ICE replication protein [Rodentibacter genomosp. 2]OOF57486.1 hypothetical protein BKK55_04295 [Rodentibacter genomosp. 2]
MSTQNKKTYFNLHTTGVGYLSDIRTVTPKKGSPFLACRIAALVGDNNDVEYRHFDINVNGKEAVGLIERCQKAVDEKRKVLISFNISDIWTDTFTYTKDTQNHKKGDVGVSLKGRLIRIDMIKVDGEVKYKREPKSAEQGENQ